MKFLPLPVFDDAGAFLSLARNEKLKVFPEFVEIVGAINKAYLHYLFVGGDPFLIEASGVDAQLAAKIKYYYDNPSTDVPHIAEMRELTGHSVCPMCGSLHSGTIDHFLPKGDYPEYSLFSPNLVPACICNSKRGSLLKGASVGERVLHPYFDSCLSERLVAASFECLGEVPKVGVSIAVDETHPKYAAIDFHVRNLVMKTSLCGFLRDRWVTLLRRPSLVFREFKGPAPSLEWVRQAIEDELHLLDDLYGSKNNWMSIFAAGCLNDDVARWIFDGLNRPDRQVDGPLI